MRHNRKFNHLGRKSNHRKAMLANMATSLIMHKKIKTTVAKAKALRRYVEPLITKSKEDSTQSRRVVFSYLQNKDAVSELFREVSPKIMERPGGYTRILKIGNRVGDNAEMCIMELVDYNENLLAAKAETATKAGRRRRRGGSKKKEEAATQQPEEKVEKQEPEEKIETQEPTEKDETQESPEKDETQKLTEKDEIQESEKDGKEETAEKKVETKAPEEEVETIAPEDDAEALKTEKEEAGADKEETPEKVVDTAGDEDQENIPESGDEKKQDDTKNEKKE